KSLICDLKAGGMILCLAVIACQDQKLFEALLGFEPFRCLTVQDLSFPLLGLKTEHFVCSFESRRVVFTGERLPATLQTSGDRSYLFDRLLRSLPQAPHFGMMRLDLERFGGGREASGVILRLGMVARGYQTGLEPLPLVLSVNGVLLQGSRYSVLRIQPKQFVCDLNSHFVLLFLKMPLSLREQTLLSFQSSKRFGCLRGKTVCFLIGWV